MREMLAGRRLLILNCGSVELGGALFAGCEKLIELVASLRSWSRVRVRLRMTVRGSPTLNATHR